MKTVKRRSQKQERSVAKTFNAKTTPASGAKWAQKGDVRNEKFLIECKTTEKDFYSITTKVWEKICLEAIKDHGRIPLLVIDLNDYDRYVVFRPRDLYDQTPEDLMVDVSYCSPHGGCKSFRFHGIPDNGDSLLFSIIPDKMNVENHYLMVMPINEFRIKFKEDI